MVLQESNLRQMVSAGGDGMLSLVCMVGQYMEIWLQSMTLLCDSGAT